MSDLASLVVKVDSRDVRRGKDDLDAFSRAGGQAEKSAISMGAAVRAAAAAFGAFAGAREFLRIADQMTNLESRIKLTLTATQDYANVQKELLDVANSSRVALQDVGTLYARLAPAVQKLGGGQREAVAITNALSKALLISGASTAEASSAIIQFSQAMASGALRGEEFNAISEAAPIILQKLEQSLGVTRGELRKMAEQGLLTSEVVGNVMTGAVGDLEKQAASMAMTVQGAMQIFRNELAVAVQDLDKTTGASAALAGAITDVSTAIGEYALAYRTGNFSEQQQTMIGIAGAVGGIAAAYVSVQTALIVLTGLQWAFNTAVRANPLIMGLSVVAAGIAAVYGYAEAQNAAKSSTQKLAEAEKNLANLRERAASKSPSVAAAAAQQIASAEKKVKELTATVANETDKMLDKVVAEAMARPARTAADAYVTLGKNAQDAGVKVKTGMDKAGDAARKAAQDAADALRRIEDAKRSIQSNLDDQELQAAGIPSSLLSLLNDPNATAGNIRQAGQIEQQRIDMQSLEDQARATADGIKAAADQVNEYLNADFGANLAAGFDEASQSLGQFVSSFTKLIDMQDKYNLAREEAKGDVATLAKLEAKNARDQIGAYASITGAAKGFFKEGSKGYKALESAETAFRAVQLALALKDIAVKLGLMQTETAAVVATEGVKQGAYAVTAQASALTIPPPASFAALAAVVAVLASLGLSGKGAKGPGFTDNNGTGTVLGDPSAQSESIANSIEALESAASLENRISSAMLASLKNIEANIGGLASLVVRGDVGGGLAAGVGGSNMMSGKDLIAKAGVGLFGGAIGLGLDKLTGGFLTSAATKINEAMLKLAGPVGDFLGAAINKLLGGAFGSKSKITGQGLTAAPQALGEIMQNGFDLLEFVAIETKKKAFGITTSTKNSIKTELADPELARQFSLIFSNIAESVALAGEALGRDVTAALQGVVIDIGNINLQGLSGEAIQEKLTAVFGAAADNIARQAIGGLDAFQRVGEGYFETVVRVASGVEYANSVLERLGVTAINYTNILNTQGDVATEIIRQSVVLRDASVGVAGGFAEIVQNFNGSADELGDLVLQLRDLQDILVTTGKQAQFLTTFMIQAAGGLDAFNDGMKSYFDDFLSPAEQAAELIRQVSVEFAQLGMLVPESVDGYKDLIASIDISTQEGQKLYGSLIALIPAFVDMTDAIEAAGNASAQFEDDIKSAFAELRQAVQQAESDLQAAFQRESATLRDTIKTFGDLSKTLRDFAMSLAGVVEAPAASLVRLRAEYNALVTRGMLGDTTAAAGIPTAGKALADAAIANAGSAIEAAREIAKIRADALAVAAVADRQKSIAEQQLEALTLSVDGLIQVGDNILTVRDAVDNLRALQTFENKAIADASAAGFSALIQANQGTLSAIERGTAASGRIEAAISGLLDVAAREEAARIAREQAQQAAIEAAQRAEAERQRLAKIEELQAQGVGALQSYGETKSIIDAANAKIKEYINFGGGAFLSSGDFGSQNRANEATFARGGLGESYSNVAGIDAFSHGSQAKREAVAFQQISVDQYAAGLTLAQVLGGGLNSQLVNAYTDAQNLRQQIISLGGVPAFATGGMHSGGWRVVGENGPELEYTGPSRIFSNAQSRSMMDTSALQAEVSMLRAELKSAMFAVAKNTMRTADRLDRWDGDGLPEERVA